MARNWIVREGVASVTIEKDEKTVLIKARRHASIKRGETLVLLNTEREFTALAKVKEVSGADEAAPNTGSEQKITRIVIEGWKPLSEPVEFDLFTSSLTFVHNRAKPWLHLRRGYRSLPVADLATIEQGEPFVAREAYHILLDALPESMQRKFQAERMLAITEEDETSFRERARALVEFIRHRVLSAGEAIIRVAGLWREVRQITESSESLGAYFLSPENVDAIDSIETQAQIFDAYQRYSEQLGEDGQSLLDIVDQRTQAAQQDGVAQRFEALFAKGFS